MYYARLCWNGSGWNHPTGEAAQVEHPDTYAAQCGFGHEEWLFNFQWMVDGWKYGFLQPVNRSRAKVVGTTIGIKLYTVGPGSSWFYVGELRRCEVLTDEQAQTAFAAFEERGWLEQMEEQVEAAGGDIRELRYDTGTSLFNVRFRQQEAEHYDPIRPVQGGDALRTLRRYTLTAATPERRLIEQQWATRAAATTLRPTEERRRRAIATGTVHPVEAQLQNELYVLLKKKYGADAVLMEHNFVDLKVKGRNGSLLIEVKADSRPRHAVRAALGQLASYAFQAESEGERVKGLVVVGPAKISATDNQFIEHLRARWRMPLRYVQFQSGDLDVDL